MTRYSHDGYEIEGNDDILELLEGEGARSAVAALIEVANDRKASGAARVSASTSLLRAAGYFAGREEAPNDGSLSENTDWGALRRSLEDRLAQLDAIIAEANVEQADEDKPDQDQGQDEGVFG